MNIRKATARDIRSVAKVHAESWRTAYKGIVPDEYLSFAETVDWEEHWSSIEKPEYKTQVFVADSEEFGVVGVASAGPERTGDNVYAGELYALYLLPNFQGIGLGKRLTITTSKHLVEIGIHSMLVWMFKNNTRARLFYQALGADYIRDKEITVAGGLVTITAYGWKDLTVMTEV